MKTLFKISGLIILTLIIASYIFQNHLYNLNIRIEGIKDIKGNIEIAIYDKKENFLKTGTEYITESIPVTRNYLLINYKLPKGFYAIALYQDVNKNGNCDKNFFGIPTEGFGFSNNYKPKLKNPGFDDCKIYLSSDKDISIKLLFY